MDDLTQRGIAAAKAGQKAEAYQFLTQAVKANPRNGLAWLWLSGVVDTDADRRTCLENVLAIDPQNEGAKCGLAILDARREETVVKPFLRAEPSPKPGPPSPVPTPASPIEAPRMAGPQPQKAKKRGRNLTLLAVLAVVGTAVVAVCSTFWVYVALAPIPTITGDPQGFVLTLADMPPGFAVVSNNTGPMSNEDLASQYENFEEALARLQKWERINGYEVGYAKSGFAAVVVNWVSVFKASNGAHAYFADFENSYVKEWLTLPLVPMPTLVSESKAYMIVQVLGEGENRLEWTTYLMVFRKRNGYCTLPMRINPGLASLVAAAVP